jgi:hypothetical protein
MEKTRISSKRLRDLFLAVIYLLGLLGIIASGGGSGGGSNPPPESDKCEIGSSKIGDCKI